MKPFIFSIFLIFCITNLSKAQDSLTLKSGEIIQVKVMEVNSTEVKYKKYDNVNGPTYAVVKSDLLLIRYENGTKDDFSAIKNTAADISDMYVKGRSDATENYTNYKVAGTATLLTTSIPVWGILFGLGPAAICSSTAPSDENLGYPDPRLMQNNLYASGYREHAKEMKSKKVFKNYLIGIPIYIATTFGILVLALGALH